MNKSSGYYQKKMGREWLIRKDMIRVIAQVEIGNIEISLTILRNIKKQHKEMLKAEEYRLALHFVDFADFAKKKSRITAPEYHPLPKAQGTFFKIQT